jgi:hypothetical protein
VADDDDLADAVEEGEQQGEGTQEGDTPVARGRLEVDGQDQRQGLRESAGAERSAQDVDEPLMAIRGDGVDDD